MATATRSEPSAKGGTVEPTNRAAVAKSTSRDPGDRGRGERYELRDPLVDVTYRSGVVTEVIAKADQLGSDRFTAITDDGRRTVVKKINSEWQRGPQLHAAKQRPLDPTPAGEDVADPPGESRHSPAKPASPQHANASDMSKREAEAERAALVARLEVALKERYVIKKAPVVIGAMTLGQTEYRFRADTSSIAFTESTFRLATETNSPSVARSMVDVAQARNWKGLRVSGAEDFRRLVWLEASVRGVKAVGYEPNPGDLDVLKRERDARRTNRIEPALDAGTAATSVSGEKATARGGGRKAVVAAIDAVLSARKVPEAKRAAVLAAVAEKLSQRGRSDPAPRVRVYDPSADPQRASPVHTLTPSRAQERASPAPTR